MTISDIKDQVAIVGIGETKVGKLLEETEQQLACAAIKAALDEAGIDPGEVDGLCSFSIETTSEEEIARDLGMGDLTFFANSPAGGGGGCATVGYAAMALVTGQADVVVAWRSRKRSGVEGRPWMGTAPRLRGSAMWTRPNGIVRPVDELALFYRRYMHEHGGTRDHLCNVALACRQHANNNPASILYEKTLDRETYFTGRWISDPLCLFDCCLETDLAQAVVLVRADRAKDTAQQPVYIHGFGQGITRDASLLAGCFGPDPLHTQGYICSKKLFSRSDFQPGDVDVAQLYDSFTPWVLVQLESYGFCERGEAGPFTDDGGLTINGKLPCNTAGGSLSDGYSHGYNHILEGVRQMRGSSVNQVAGAQSCLVTSSDGAPTSALLFRAA
jgi:acetyl-CoA acetyltransferase